MGPHKSSGALPNKLLSARVHVFNHGRQDDNLTFYVTSNPKAQRRTPKTSDVYLCEIYLARTAAQ